jgi:hypothetical protein
MLEVRELELTAHQAQAEGGQAGARPQGQLLAGKGARGSSTCSARRTRQATKALPENAPKKEGERTSST